ncbi:E3 ubiquitin-protein ligase RNF182-like [Ambystoma mexicanum]|uniref:E3 ubiquitin-protein ligase RNF182-like n=1 Tax=Ambystoma mexicanum TaxID=8296 RepID=UPI0037E9C29A
MSCPQIDGEEKVPNDDMECKICYQRFNTHSRKPKILHCLHRICVRCLTKIYHTGEDAACISCPFCRHDTKLQEDQVAGLPDDTIVISRLTVKDKTAWNPDCNEVVLTPKNLSSSSPSQGSSNCLVITIMEVQRDSTRTSSQNTTSDYYADNSPDSLSVNSHSQTEQDLFSKLCTHVPRILVWLLGFFYFGSLPLGIYLLVIQKVTLGIICVSLVPSSLTVCLVYGFCQCLCQGICDCSARN